MAPSVETEYRSAFEDFSRKARRVQFLTEHPTDDPKAFETALLELQKAHLAYDRARDALVQSLLPARTPSSQDHQRPPDTRDHHADIQALAELLWVSAGRPTGTAEEDWRRAEAIVKRAVAATSCG